MHKWTLGRARRFVGVALVAVSSVSFSFASAKEIIHDAEYYVLKAQNGERWAAQDEMLDAKLAELREKHGQPPNIVYILWDDTAFGAVGFPGTAEELRLLRPRTSTAWPPKGITFTRMYTEPSCTPTRAADADRSTPGAPWHGRGRDAARVLRACGRRRSPSPRSSPRPAMPPPSAARAISVT